MTERREGPGMDLGFRGILKVKFSYPFQLGCTVYLLLLNLEAAVFFWYSYFGDYGDIHTYPTHPSNMVEEETLVSRRSKRSTAGNRFVK